MKILSIGTDRKIFDEKSSSARRMLGYGEMVDELHIIVFSLQGLSLKQKKLSEKVFLYPTNSRNRLMYLWDAIRIGRKIKNIDLVSTQDPFETGFVGLVLKKILNIKLQVQIHTDFLSVYFKNGLLNRFRVKIASITLPRADGVRAVSQRIKNSVSAKLKIDKGKIDVLPIFTDVEVLKKSEVKSDLHKKYPQFDFIILMASRFEIEKNILLAIKAFKNVLQNTNKNIGLVIVGSGSEKDFLLDKVSELKIQNDVVFEAWSNDLPSYYKTCDLFLNTSNYEGFGLSILEAFFCGASVLTSDVGLVGDILDEENIMVCPVGDQKCFQDKIELFLEGGVQLNMDLPQEKLASGENQYLENYLNLWEKII